MVINIRVWQFDDFMFLFIVTLDLMVTDCTPSQILFVALCSCSSMQSTNASNGD